MSNRERINPPWNIWNISPCTSLKLGKQQQKHRRKKKVRKGSLPREKKDERASGIFIDCNIY